MAASELEKVVFNYNHTHSSLSFSYNCLYRAPRLFFFSGQNNDLKHNALDFWVLDCQKGTLHGNKMLLLKSLNSGNLYSEFLISSSWVLPYFLTFEIQLLVYSFIHSFIHRLRCKGLSTLSPVFYFSDFGKLALSLWVPYW